MGDQRRALTVELQLRGADLVDVDDPAAALAPLIAACNRNAEGVGGRGVDAEAWEIYEAGRWQALAAFADLLGPHAG